MSSPKYFFIFINTRHSSHKIIRFHFISPAGLAIRIHDADFAFESKDYLGKKCMIVWDIATLILESLPAVFFKLISNYFQFSLINCVFASYSILEILSSGSFNKSCTRKVSLSFSIFYFLTAVLIIASVTQKNACPISLVIICFIPLSY